MEVGQVSGLSEVTGRQTVRKIGTVDRLDVHVIEDLLCLLDPRVCGQNKIIELTFHYTGRN